MADLIHDKECPMLVALAAYGQQVLALLGRDCWTSVNPFMNSELLHVSGAAEGHGKLQTAWQWFLQSFRWMQTAGLIFQNWIWLWLSWYGRFLERVARSRHQEENGCAVDWSAFYVRGTGGIENI